MSLGQAVVRCVENWFSHSYFLMEFFINEGPKHFSKYKDLLLENSWAAPCIA